MKVILLHFVLLFKISSIALSQNILKGDEIGKRGDLRILFYNVENLFDCFNDSLTLDDEFLPKGDRAWTWKKYQKKTQQIVKIIASAGEWEFPDIIALCEIENRFVLDGIFQYQRLSKVNYQIIHRDSPDRRGIDVALIYRKERFQPIDTVFIPLVYPRKKHSTTREILYVKGKTHTDDTLYFFVNHWPSRWGGQYNSEYKRIAAAKLLRKKIEEIFQKDTLAKIIIMGDFNDYPYDKSLSEYLKANRIENPIKNLMLYNLAINHEENTELKSHKYRKKWGMLDQFIVSGGLLNKSGILYCEPTGMSIFAPDFLLEQDLRYMGVKPYRTFIGYKYHGGYSDHLPVILDLWRK